MPSCSHWQAHSPPKGLPAELLHTHLIQDLLISSAPFAIESPKWVLKRKLSPKPVVAELEPPVVLAFKKHHIWAGCHRYGVKHGVKASLFFLSLRIREKVLPTSSFLRSLLLHVSQKLRHIHVNVLECTHAHKHTANGSL